SAIYYHLEAVTIGQAFKDTVNLIDYLNNLALDYYRNRDYKQALDNHKQSLSLAQLSKLGNKIYRSYHGISSTLIDSAGADTSLNFLYDEALQYLQIFLAEENEKIDAELYADAYNNAGLAYQYRSKTDLDSAMFYFKKSEIFYKKNELLEACVPISNIGLLYMLKNDNKNAIQYLKESNLLALEEDNKKILRINYQNLAIIYDELGDPKKAYDYLNQFILYDDSIFAEEKSRAIAELQTKYETEKKEKIIAQKEKENTLQEIENTLQERRIERKELTNRITIGSSVLSLIIIGLLFSRRQLRKKLEYEKRITTERSRISSDLHDEIGSTLSSISMYSDFAKQQMESNKQEEAMSLLDDISNNSREMMDDMSDIIWTINPRNDSFENVITRIENYAHKISETKNIQLHFNTSENFDNIIMQMEKRRNIYLILKESINNAVKYSGCANLYLSIKKNSNLIDIEIKDDGKGFNINKEQDGNGIRNIRSRAEAMHAQLKIDSEPGAGTSIHLQLNFT
ncbi:MAG: hypothetical protein H7Y00_14220, partial [Fimbriimonadaceae bacterium]|nr:hypothetical protein [Chitinophagales bacterium]